jgi:hypothetical protein
VPPSPSTPSGDPVRSGSSPPFFAPHEPPTISETKYARAVTNKLQEYKDKGDLKSAPIKEHDLANFARYAYTRLYAVHDKNRDRLIKWRQDNEGSH